MLADASPTVLAMPNPSSWLPPELEGARREPVHDPDDPSAELAAAEESRRQAEERLSTMLDAQDAQLAEIETLRTRLRETEQELARVNARLAESEAARPPSR